MNFPQCVYNDDTVKGFENCEYKIIHSLEEFLKLPLNWGKSQRAELKSEGFEVPSNDDDFDSDDLESEVDSDDLEGEVDSDDLEGEVDSDDLEGEVDSFVESVAPRKRGRPPKVRD